MIPIESSAEASAERPATFARYPRGVQRSSDPREHNCEQQSCQHQPAKEVNVDGLPRMQRIVAERRAKAQASYFDLREGRRQ
jgi:hypothetical protein